MRRRRARLFAGLWRPAVPHLLVFVSLREAFEASRQVPRGERLWVVGESVSHDGVEAVYLCVEFVERGGEACVVGRARASARVMAD